MESVVKIKSEDFYIGRADVTNLGDTDKIGVFMKFDLIELGELFEDNFSSFMDQIDSTDETIVNKFILNIKLLPLKDENILENKTHSVKAHLSLEQEEKQNEMG